MSRLTFLIFEISNITAIDLSFQSWPDTSFLKSYQFKDKR